MGHRATRKQERLIGQAGDPSVPNGFAKFLPEYLEWLQIRNYSARTVHTRDFELKLFIDWCEERGLNRPADITKPILERYQRHLFYFRKKNQKPLTAGTQRNRITSVQSFFKWLTKHNYLLWNPASELDLPRQERRLPQVLTASEAEAVLNQTNLQEPLGVRDRAILELFYATGLRRMELVNLRVSDLDDKSGILAIRQGKGKKDRFVPVGERATAWVQKYRLDVRPELMMLPDEGILFLNYLGEALNMDSLSRLVANYVDAAQIGKRGSCHIFRHTMATLMLEGGADVRFVQQMLGHASLETTQVYTRVSIRKLKEIHAATHPGVKLKRQISTSDDEDLLSF